MAKRIPRTDRFETWPLAKLKEDPRNARVHPDANDGEMEKSLTTYGQTWPLLVQPDGTIIAGHWRRRVMLKLGWTECKVLVAEGWSKRNIQAYLIADNQMALLSEWDNDKLAEQIKEMLSASPLDELALGFTQDDIDNLFNPKGRNTGVSGSLAATFGVPPFTVMNAREGWWQTRKSLWIKLGIKSELGRADTPPGGAGKTAAYRARGRKKDGPPIDPALGEPVWGEKL